MSQILPCGRDTFSCILLKIIILYVTNNQFSDKLNDGQKNQDVRFIGRVDSRLAHLSSYVSSCVFQVIMCVVLVVCRVS